jgi:hypothetical protein
VDPFEGAFGGERRDDVIGKRIAGRAPTIEGNLRVRRQVLEVREPRPDVEWRQAHRSSMKPSRCSGLLGFHFPPSKCRASDEDG